MKNKILICYFILLLFLYFIICFIKSKNINETLTIENDEPLKSYLAQLDYKYKKYQEKSKISCNGKPLPPFKSYISGIKQGNNTCEYTKDNITKIGASWVACYKNDKQVDAENDDSCSSGKLCDICVPDEYSSNDTYIPCSSEKPGLPNLEGCGFPDDKCKNEINKIENDIVNYKKYRNVDKEDIQQYLFACRKKSGKPICPCMRKWGKDYKPYNCDPIPYNKISSNNAIPNNVMSNNAMPNNDMTKDYCIQTFNLKEYDKNSSINNSNNKTINYDKGNKSPQLYNEHPHISYNNPVNLTNCISFEGNINDRNNKNLFNKKCKELMNFPSKMLYTTSIDCPQPNNTRAVCSFTSPEKILHGKII